MSNNDTYWRSYEEVAQYILNEMAEKFGLARVEGKQSVSGIIRSGATYEIDAKGITEDGVGFVIIECKRYTKSKQKQEVLAGLAYRIFDSGAKGGIIVSPLALQKGAAKIALAENIISIRLDENSTTENYILQFLNNIFVGRTDGITFSDKVDFKVTEKSSP